MISRTTVVAALCAQMIAAAVDSAASDDGIVRLRRLHLGNSMLLEEIHFSKVLSGEDPVLILEAGPFKLEASCKTVTIEEERFFEDFEREGDSPAHSEETGSASGTGGGGSITDGMSKEDYLQPDPPRYRTFTESFAALDLTYTAVDADYLYGSTAWWEDNHPQLVGSYEAGESRKNTVYHGMGGNGDFDYTLQTTSGSFITVRGVSGVHEANVKDLPGDYAYFPAGVDCMLAGFVTYTIPAIGLAEAEVADPRSVKYL